ncbi:MAG: hypothetical protein VX496_08805 [Planctomycetota bacterium]|nr:hypothetical protein [Planctomycetota bacterium]
MNSALKKFSNLFFCLLLIVLFHPSLPAAEEWEIVLKTNITSEYSKTRYDSLKQVDTSSAKGLKAIWNVLDKLAPRDPLRYDWYVKQGAYEALMAAEGEDAEKEIFKVLKGSKRENSKEAIIHSLIYKIRQQFEKDKGGNEERKVEHYKELLRRRRGIQYFALVLPSIRKHDPDKKKFGWITTAFKDSSTKVRLAALQGMLAYPDKSSIKLLLDNLRKLEKKKSKYYSEWVQTRFALETLTGQYYRDNVDDWFKWWDAVKDQFSLEKRIEDEAPDPENLSAAPGDRRTRVVRSGGVEVTVNMKVAGKGYPLLVLPKRGYSPDYFRPYFHGVEEFCKVYYVQMPRIQDFKGLARTTNGNFVIYPTEILAGALADLMKSSGLDEFAIFAHGPGASTLGMYMASKFSSSVTRLIMVNPASAGSEYSKAIKNVEREGRKRKNPEAYNGANSIMIGQDGKPTYEAQDDAERGGLQRAIGNLAFADPSRPEIGVSRHLNSIAGDPQVMNDSKWNLKQIFKYKAPRLPVMIMIGQLDFWTPVADVTKVTKFFTRSYVAKFPRSGQYPFRSDPYRFTKEMEKILGKAKLRSKSKKKD